MAVYVLDTSAVVAFVREEPGEQEVSDLLERAQSEEGLRLLLPFMVLMEIEYVLLRTYPRDVTEATLAIMGSWPIEVIESHQRWRRAAAHVKASYRLSLGDAWIAALALLEDADLVHKDPEFDAVPGLKALRLPDNQGSPEPA